MFSRIGIRWYPRALTWQFCSLYTQNGAPVSLPRPQKGRASLLPWSVQAQVAGRAPRPRCQTLSFLSWQAPVPGWACALHPWQGPALPPTSPQASPPPSLGLPATAGLQLQAARTQGECSSSPWQQPQQRPGAKEELQNSWPGQEQTEALQAGLRPRSQNTARLPCTQLHAQQRSRAPSPSLDPEV